MTQSHLSDPAHLRDREGAGAVTFLVGLVLGLAAGAAAAATTLVLLNSLWAGA